MTLEEFTSTADLLRKREVEKVCLLAFFFLKKGKKEEFSVTDAVSWLHQAALSVPNKTRLESNLSQSPDTIKGRTPGTFRLHFAFMKTCSEMFPTLVESDEVEATGSILPIDLYSGTRGYVERLGNQINASYEHAIFDGCSVLMRRLLEILLILSYETLLIADSIKDLNGTYKMLEAVIENAKGNGALNLSRNSRESIDHFRQLGNFSAHKIHYNCRRQDIKAVMLQYRALIEELLYKSGLRT